MEGSGPFKSRVVCIVSSVAGTWLVGAGLDAQEIIDLPREDQLPEPEFEEVCRVGPVTGEDWEQFGNVRALGFGGTGRLHVYDSQADRITVVGPGADLEGEAVFNLVGARNLRVGMATMGRTTPHASRPVERIILTGDVAVKDTVAEGWLPPGGDRSGLPVGGQVNYGLPPRRVFGPHIPAGVLPDGSVAFSGSTIVGPDTDWRGRERESFLNRV